MRKIRYAVVGLGCISMTRIIPEGFALDRSRFEAPAEFELTGCWSRNHAHEAHAKAFGLHWYSSYGELLADPAIDAVFIATNNRTHFPLAEAALEAEKHVIVEKPMTTSVGDAEILCRLAAEKKLSLAINHMMVKNDLNLRAARMIREGELGEVSSIVVHTEGLFAPDRDRAAAWRCADPAELGGPVGDIGSHCFYLAEFLAGSPIEKLQAVRLPASIGAPIRVEPGAFIAATHANGIHTEIRCSFVSPRPGPGGSLAQGYEVYGSTGVLRALGTACQLSGHADEPVAIRLEFERLSGDLAMIRAENPANIYAEVIREHARSILDGAPMSGADGLRNVTLCTAAIQQIQTPE